MQSPPARRLAPPAIAIGIYFFLVAGAFAHVTPLFQAPDEPFHLNYINFVVTHHALPNQDKPAERAEDEGHQAPLYYVLGAAFVSACNSGRPIEARLRLRDGAWQSLPDVRINPHGLGLDIAEAEIVTPRGRVLFAALRMLGVVCSLVTLVFLYKISRLFFGESYWALAPLLLAATLPQFAFNSGSVTNDNLANLCCAASLYYAFQAAAQPGRTAVLVRLGICTGLAICVKKTGMFLLPAVPVMLILGCRHRLAPRRMAQDIGVFFALAIGVSGWIFVRNLVLFHELMATEMEKRSFPSLVVQKSLFSGYFLSEYPRIASRSFIAQFGWMNVMMPRAFYIAYYAVLIAGVVGAALYLKADRLRDGRVTAAIWAVLVCTAGILSFNLTFSQPQGRYYLPVLALITTLLTVGMKTLVDRLPARVSRAAVLAPAAAILIASDLFALVFLHHSYHHL